MSLTQEAELTFDDKSLMLVACGPNDATLKTLAQTHNVHYTAKGLRVTFTGSNAEKALQDLKNGQHKSSRHGSAKPRTKGQEAYKEILDTFDMALCDGPAGTGKTRLAVDAMVRRLEQGAVERLIFSRPAVDAGERLGFLPGDLKEKVDPYMQPIYDALGSHYTAKTLTKMMEDKVIEIAPIAFLRGRTFQNCGIVIDEAQNLTKTQMKMTLTRIGTNSAMAIVGDSHQIDLPGKANESGFVDAIARLKNIPEIGIHILTKEDVVRHRLVRAILEAYDDDV